MLFVTRPVVRVFARHLTSSVWVSIFGAPQVCPPSHSPSGRRSFLSPELLPGCREAPYPWLLILGFGRRLWNECE